MNLINAFDIVITVSYFSIPCEILYFTYRLPIHDDKAVVACLLFCTFIMLCGITHMLHTFTQGVVAAVLWGLTAIVSAVTSVALLFVIPRLLQLPLTLEDKRRELETSNAFRSVVMDTCTHANMRAEENLLPVACQVLQHMFSKRNVTTATVTHALSNVHELVRGPPGSDASALLVLLIDNGLYNNKKALFDDVASFLNLLDRNGATPKTRSTDISLTLSSILEDEVLG